MTTIISETTAETVADPTAATTFTAPLYVAWELTHHCNAECIHCYSDSGPNVCRSDELPLEDALGLIDQLAEAGVLILAFSGGEPLLHRHWRKLARHAVMRGLGVNIGTNGSCITDRVAREIKELGVKSVTVSLDSHIEHVHDDFRKLDGLYRRAVQAIRRLVANDVRVVVGFTPTRLNWTHGREVVRIAHELGAAAVNLSEYVPAGRGSIDLALKPNELHAVLREWIDLRERYLGRIQVIWHNCRVGMLVPESEQRKYVGCGAGRLVARILPNGTLTRISHTAECIGAANQRKPLCCNNFRRRAERPMLTECRPDLFGFAPVEGREVVAAFDAGAITSDAGALLLGATDRAIRMMDRLASCFHDERRADLIEHEVATLVGQRVFGIALGYEDLNDHDELRHDPLMAVLAGKLEARREDCAPVAGKSTLNRLELSRLEPTRYHKISHNPMAIKRLLVDLFLEAHERAPNEIILDLDATDDPLHGEQEGRFFHGYYDCYCYLPLYVFCGRHLLAAKLRRANIDAAAGSVAEVARIVAHIRRRWPLVRILVRADSGFAREELMAWCEANGVHFLFGLAKNDRLIAEIKTELDQAAVQSRRTGKPARRFKDFRWTTRSSWSRRRRVVAKAEWTKDEANPRFVVTSLTRDQCKARYLYEKVYCARGDMENRIKECQLDLYADRTSTATMRANQLRLWFASMAYVLLCALRRIGLPHTPFAKATCGTIRLKLLKIGALVRVSVRRIKVAMASACPAAHAWGCAATRLAAANARASPV